MHARGSRTAGRRQAAGGHDPSVSDPASGRAPAVESRRRRSGSARGALRRASSGGAADRLLCLGRRRTVSSPTSARGPRWATGCRRAPYSSAAGAREPRSQRRAEEGCDASRPEPARAAPATVERALVRGPLDWSASPAARRERTRGSKSPRRLLLLPRRPVRSRRRCRCRRPARVHATCTDGPPSEPRDGQGPRTDRRSPSRPPTREERGRGSRRRNRRPSGLWKEGQNSKATSGNKKGGDSNSLRPYLPGLYHLEDVKSLNRSEGKPRLLVGTRGGVPRRGNVTLKRLDGDPYFSEDYWAIPGLSVSRLL